MFERASLFCLKKVDFKFWAGLRDGTRIEGNSQKPSTQKCVLVLLH